MEKEIKKLYYKQTMDLMEIIRSLSFFYQKNIGLLTENKEISVGCFLKDYLKISQNRFSKRNHEVDFWDNREDAENLKLLLVDFFKVNKELASSVLDFAVYKFWHFWRPLNLGVFDSINKKITKAINNIPNNKYSDDLIQDIESDFLEIDRLWKDVYDKLSNYVLDSFFNIK